MRDHGTHHRYRSGCRCDPCKTAWTAYHRAWRASKTWDQIPHGTDTGYAGYGCRCDDCRAAHREQRREDRKRSNASPRKYTFDPTRTTQRVIPQ